MEGNSPVEDGLLDIAESLERAEDAAREKLDRMAADWSLVGEFES